VRYERELAELPNTYAAVRGADPEPLRAALVGLAAGPARFVGTGGTSAVARLAEQLHEVVSGQPARALTPLELIDAAPLRRAGAVIFSARARHADALLVLDHLALGAYTPALLVTHRDPRELELEKTGSVTAIQVRPPALREGFLATNSVLAMSTALVIAALGPDQLPGDLLVDLPAFEPAEKRRDRLLVLHPPALAPVAIDIETRCSELGLAAVQVSDLRNFAHGRHTGLARTAERHDVVVLSDQSTTALADAVQALLDQSGARVLRWHADEPWPAATIRLLAAAMHLVANLAAAGGLDAARPPVPEFGRRLYHLPLRRLVARPNPTPVEAKLAAVGAGELARGDLRERYGQAFYDWTAEIATTAFGALVLDYDGTVCTTAGRYQLPERPVREALGRLLDESLELGFASGRGKSLHADLRAWVPQARWPHVTVGLYNGAVIQSLAEDLPDLSKPTELMKAVIDRLGSAHFGPLLTAEARWGQVTVTATSGTFFHAGRMGELVRELLARPPRLAIKVVASAHSVDIVAEDTTKVRVLEAVAERCAGAVLAIGDQGDIAGNDFELLGATSKSITVDRASADPTRCWNVDPAGARGWQALVRLLGGLECRDGLATLNLSRPTRRRA
jgi:hydroxymethylpyrimidine pyrophosphatase-like HAD family hydrolase